MRGMAGVLFGLVALFSSRPSLAPLASWLSTFMLINGAVALVGGLGSNLRTMLREAAVYLAAAAALILWPRSRLLTPVHVLVITALATGFLQVRLAMSLHRIVGHEWPLVLAGVSSIVLGVMLAVYATIDTRNFLQVTGEYAFVWGELLLIAAVALGARRRPSWIRT